MLNLKMLGVDDVVGDEELLILGFATADTRDCGHFKLH